MTRNVRFFIILPFVAALLSACGTSNVDEFRKRGPEYTLTSKMSYENLGECIWQIRTKRTGGPGVLHRFNNVNSKTYRISYVMNVSFGSQLSYIIETSPLPQDPSASLVTVYALRGVFGAHWPQSAMQDDIKQCETYSN